MPSGLGANGLLSAPVVSSFVGLLGDWSVRLGFAKGGFSERRFSSADSGELLGDRCLGVVGEKEVVCPWNLEAGEVFKFCRSLMA